MELPPAVARVVVDHINDYLEGEQLTRAVIDLDAEPAALDDADEHEDTEAMQIPTTDSQPYSLHVSSSTNRARIHISQSTSPGRTIRLVITRDEARGLADAIITTLERED